MGFIYFETPCTTWLTAVSSYCLAALPAKMSAFNSDMPQNAYHRNWNRTFEDLLPCNCCAIKANAGKWANCKLITAWH